MPSFTRTLNYHASRGGPQALIVKLNNVNVVESYAGGFDASTTTNTYSLLKSIVGYLCAKFVQAGLIPSFDTKISTVLTELAGVADKKDMTFRGLLGETSGYSATEASYNTYQTAVDSTVNPGDVGTWIYTASSWDVFGKAAKTLVSPTYADLRAWVTANAPELVIASWEDWQANEPKMFAHAQMTAAAMANFGKTMVDAVRAGGVLGQVFDANPLATFYGMGWYRNFGDNAADMTKPIAARGAMGRGGAGTNKRQIIVLPDYGIVCVVYMSDDTNYSGEELYSLLIQDAFSPDAYAIDTFTDTAGVELAAHTPELGVWVEHALSTGSIVITDANRIRSNSANESFYAIATIPKNADGDVECDVIYKTDINDSAGVMWSMDAVGYNGYLAIHTTIGTYKWQLGKITSGVLSTIGPNYNQTLTANLPYRLTLRKRGPNISLLVNGIERSTAVDSSFQAVGRAGVWFNNVLGSNTTGHHIDNFTATNAARAMSPLMRVG